MPSNMNLQITQQSQREFNSLIDEMQKATGADIDKVIRNMGRDFLRSALAKTPFAKKKAKLYKLQERRDGSTFYKFLGKGTPKGRGFAKSAWVAMFPKVGLSSSASVQAGAASKQATDFIWRKSSGFSNMELANQVPHIEALDQGDENNKPRLILLRSMSDLKHKTEKHLDKLARKQESRFNK